MAFSEFEIKRYESIMDKFIEARRPPAHIRHQVDMAYRLEGQSIVIFEIRPHWDDPSQKLENMVAKFTFVKSGNLWKIFWQRASLKWEVYPPAPTAKTLEEALEIIDQDAHACFFG